MSQSDNNPQGGGCGVLLFLAAILFVLVIVVFAMAGNK